MIVDVVNGFLGSGKTTFIRNLVDQLAGLEKVAVLVNEFGELGIDAMLLAYPGLEVVELPSGCICCTLSADLLSQVQRIAGDIQPDRLVIEPSGVATVDSIIQVLTSLRLEKYVEGIRVFLVVDATDFDVLVEGALTFFTRQLSFTQFVIVNKCDSITPDKVVQIRETILNLSPRVRVLTTTYGQAGLSAFNDWAQGGRDARPVEAPFPGGHDHAHPGYDSLSLAFRDTFLLARLQEFFRQLDDGAYGSVSRAKGVFSTDQGWMYVDFASHGQGDRPLAGGPAESRVVFIGPVLDKAAIGRSLAECRQT